MFFLTFSLVVTVGAVAILAATRVHHARPAGRSATLDERLEQPSRQPVLTE